MVIRLVGEKNIKLGDVPWRFNAPVSLGNEMLKFEALVFLDLYDFNSLVLAPPRFTPKR